MSWKISVIILLATMISGCKEPFADVPDSELADAIYECRTATDQSPGYAIRCDNYKRECDRRREEGRFVC